MTDTRKSAYTGLKHPTPLKSSGRRINPGRRTPQAQSTRRLDKPYPQPHTCSTQAVLKYKMA